MKPNSKARSEALQKAASALLIEEKIDANGQVEILPLARLLVEREACHLNTAKIRIARAVWLARGEISKERQWGGNRPGAGRPPKDEITLSRAEMIRLDNLGRVHCFLEPDGRLKWDYSSDYDGSRIVASLSDAWDEDRGAFPENFTWKIDRT